MTDHDQLAQMAKALYEALQETYTFCPDGFSYAPTDAALRAYEEMDRGRRG